MWMYRTNESRHPLWEVVTRKVFHSTGAGVYINSALGMSKPAQSQSRMDNLRIIWSTKHFRAPRMGRTREAQLHQNRTWYRKGAKFVRFGSAAESGMEGQVVVGLGRKTKINCTSHSCYATLWVWYSAWDENKHPDLEKARTRFLKTVWRDIQRTRV